MIVFPSQCPALSVQINETSKATIEIEENPHSQSIENVNQIIETLNASDNPPSENVIEKLLNVETGSSKPMLETPTEVDPKNVCENVI